MKEILGKTDNVNIIKIPSDTTREREKILASLTENPSTVLVCCHLVKPTDGDLNAFGEALIITNDIEEGVGCNTYDVYLSAVSGQTFLPEALKLALHETFIWLNKNKVKVDVVYVVNDNLELSKMDFLNERLIFQNIMKTSGHKALGNNASLWMEKIESDDHTLFMNFSDSKDDKSKKKEKDKKKKSDKKNKKKGKK